MRCLFSSEVPINQLFSPDQSGQISDDQRALMDDLGISFSKVCAKRD